MKERQRRMVAKDDEYPDEAEERLVNEEYKVSERHEQKYEM